MQDDITRCRDNAMECRVLSVKMPEHRTALLEIADAWMAVAEKLEKSASQDDNESKSC
jgi:hypothetical protein